MLTTLEFLQKCFLLNYWAGKRSTDSAILSCSLADAFRQNVASTPFIEPNSPQTQKSGGFVINSGSPQSWGAIGATPDRMLADWDCD